MKPWLKTVLAIAFLAGVAAWVGLKETGPKEEKKLTVWKADPKDVKTFTLKDLKTGVELTCERDPKDPDAWTITKPQRLAADPETANLVAQHLAQPEIERQLEPLADLAPFGLTEPSFKGSFTDKKGRTHTILLGRKTPTDTAWFAMEEGGKAPFTLASWSADNLRKSVADLRDKRLVLLDPANVSKLVIKRKTGGTIVANRKDADHWTLEQPANAAGDRFTIDALLNDAKGLKGTEVIDDPVGYSRYKLDQPTAVIELWTGKDKQTLTLSKPKPGKDDTYASSSRLPFTWKVSNPQVLTDATKSADDFRDRLLLQRDVDNLTEAELTVHGVRYAMKKGPKDVWTVTEPAGAKAADQDIHDLLFELVYVRAEGFPDDAGKNLKAEGLKPPAVTVVMRGKEGAKVTEDRYDLGLAKGNQVLLKFADRPPVILARKDLLDKSVRFADLASHPKPEPESTNQKKK